MLLDKSCSIRFISFFKWTHPQYAAFRELYAKAHSVVGLTGAGISAESGVPTFRGSGGLWGQFNAVDLATTTAFARSPLLV